jgi:hypothetical protein
MYQSVVSVRPNEDFSISVVFEDGAKGILDMTPYLDFGVFRKLKNLDQFKTVRIAFDTVEWDCGVDLDPEFIREKCRLS